MQKIIRITFYCALVLFLLDICNVFQTKIDVLKSIVYYSVLVLPIPLVVMEFKANRSFSKAVLRKLIPVLAILGLLYLNPLKILFNTATWKTQRVALVNKNWANHKVEFQMKNSGALGYAKRNAEVFYLSNYFYLIKTNNYEIKNNTNRQWLKVDEDKNEMGLK